MSIFCKKMCAAITYKFCPERVLNIKRGSERQSEPTVYGSLQCLQEEHFQFKEVELLKVRFTN